MTKVIKFSYTQKFNAIRKRRTKKFFNERNSDECLQDREVAFKSRVFIAIVDTAMAQLKSRFKGQRLVSAAFSFLYPNSLLHLSDVDFELAATNL